MQSKLESHIETGVDLLIGFTIATLMTKYLSPFFPLTATDGAMLWTLMFTIVSYIRRYITRRLFNWYKFGRHQ